MHRHARDYLIPRYRESLPTGSDSMPSQRLRQRDRELYQALATHLNSTLDAGADIGESNLTRYRCVGSEKASNLRLGKMEQLYH